jgi:hypothetical protein
MTTTDQVTALEAKLKEILDPRAKALVEKWSKNPEAKKSSKPIVFECCPEHDHVGGGVEAWKAEMDYDPMALIYVQGSPTQIIQIGKQIFHIVPMVDQDEDPDLLTERKTLEKMVALEQPKTANPDGSCTIWIKLQAYCRSFTLRCRKEIGSETFQLVYAINC